MNSPQFASPLRSVAIIAYREMVSDLQRCVSAAQAAIGSHNAIVDVLVNGNQRLARDAAAVAHEWATVNCQVRIWSIEQGDKAHAWNEYTHRIWPQGSICFFLDAYAEPRKDAFDKLEAAITANAEVLAASGVPSSGRSAQHLRALMLRDGGMHGNMHAIGPAAMARLRAIGFRLPLGLYRVDSLINSVLTFNFDPAQHRWEPRRVAVVPDATWDVRDISRLTLGSILGHFKRMVRQARGILENRAVREHLAVRRALPQTLPCTAQELVFEWLSTQPQAARSLFIRMPLTYYAARQFRAPRDWRATESIPVCLNAPGV